ncbi:tetratricopeptide repeat protein [Streptodolium elevatio]|uniref:Tetratricopeptide repeat protein n=1 Tax=Streptodolium elevatio TaxID=3157996 RepID=A0ABV3DR56_9ACTN
METPRGFVLLVAGVGQGRRKSRALADSEAALAGWVGLPPQILVPDAPADVVQLPAGSGPQTVRGYLERSSVTPGPVIVYLTGHLMPDRRGELHVTLRDSSPGSVRYDGLPWAWLAETLRIRDPRNTLVIVDLTASADLRAEVTVAPGTLADRLPLWGVLTPPATHDDPAHAFTRTLTVAARRGFAGCPATVDPATVHPAIFGRAQLPEGTVQIVPPADTTLRLANRMPAEGSYAISYGGTRSEATGRHRAVPGRAPRDSAPPAPEPEVAVPAPAPFLQPEPGEAQDWGAGVAAGVPTTAQLRVTIPHLLPQAAEEERAAGPYLYRERVGSLRAAVAAGDFDEALALARAITHDMETRYGLGPEHRDTLDALETWAWLTARAGRIDEAVTLYTETARRSARVHGPGHATTRAAADAAHTLWLDLPDVAQARELGPAVVALRELVLGSGAHTREAAAAHLEALSAPRAPSEQPLPPPPELREALADVAAIAAEGRHDEALGAADAIVDALVADLGWEHAHTLNVREVRAYLTAESGRLADAVTAYLDIAESRLLARGPEHPDTISAADNAHALWLRLPDDDTATVSTGVRLIAVREHIPGPGGRALVGARARVRELTARQAEPYAEPAGPFPFPTRVGDAGDAPIDIWADPPTIAETEAEIGAETGPWSGPWRGPAERFEPVEPVEPFEPGTPTDPLAGTAPTGPPSQSEPPGQSEPPRATEPGAPTAQAAQTPKTAQTAKTAQTPQTAQVPPAPPAVTPVATSEPPTPTPDPSGELVRPRASMPAPIPPPPVATAAHLAPPPPPAPPSPAPPGHAVPARNGSGKATSAVAPRKAARPPAELRAALHAIKDAAAHDNHVEALTLAEELMRGVEARHGPAHPFTLNAYEVRAHLTASAGLFATAARQYTTLAHRLAEAGDPDDPAARSAADAAQALWLRLGRTEAARNLGPGIIDLRRRVPGPDGTALLAARDHLSGLTTEPRP